MPYFAGILKQGWLTNRNKTCGEFYFRNLVGEIFFCEIAYLIESAVAFFEKVGLPKTSFHHKRYRSQTIRLYFLIPITSGGE